MDQRIIDLCEEARALDPERILDKATKHNEAIDNEKNHLRVLFTHAQELSQAWRKTRAQEDFEAKERAYEACDAWRATMATRRRIDIKTLTDTINDISAYSAMEVNPPALEANIAFLRADVERLKDIATKLLNN